MSIKHVFMHFKWLKVKYQPLSLRMYKEIVVLSNDMHSIGPTVADAWSDFFISWQLIIKLIRNKSLFLWYSFTFNVVISHGIITFQDIWIDEIPKYLTSIKDTYYAALTAS